MSRETPLSEQATRPGQARDPQAPVLVPFCFWLARPCGPGREARPPQPAELSDAIRAHLAATGQPGAEPLRWAITAVDPLQGLQLEGVGLRESGSLGER